MTRTTGDRRGLLGTAPTIGVAAFVVAALCALPFIGCGPAIDPWQGEVGKTRVVVTIAPLESFVRAVGGDRVAVRCLCTTTGPHHYQPDTRDALLLGKADLFLGVGLTLDESFADSMYRSARRKALPYVKLGDELPESARLEMKHACCRHAGPGHEHHHHGEWDPHVWLGVPQAVRLVEQVRDQLKKIDPGHAADYEKQAALYVDQLGKLHEEGKKLLADRGPRRIVSFHEVLGYLADSFGLEIADVIEQGPGDEPTQGHLKDLIKVCSDADKPVAAIAVEPQYAGSSSAKVIQDELARRKVTVPLVTVDPLETAEPAELLREGGDWYLSRMRRNLKALAEALPAAKKTAP